MTVITFRNSSQNPNFQNIPKLVAQRPDFGPDQIKSPKEVNVGDKVIQVYFKDKETEPVEVVGYFFDSIGTGFMVRTQYGNLTKMFYADKGLKPYDNGKWNPINWLKKVK
jgi:hypothetical protein